MAIRPGGNLQDARLAMPAAPQCGTTCHANEQGVSSLVRKHPKVLTEATARIDHHPHRITAFHMPCCQLRIVMFDGACTNNHGINQSSQPMQVHNIFRSRYVMGRAGPGRNLTIKAYPKMRHDEWPRLAGQRHRQIEIQNRGDLIADLSLRGPAPVSIDCEKGSGIADVRDRCAARYTC